MKAEKPTQNLFKMIRNFLLCYFDKIEERALHHRFRFLGGATAVGIVLALGWYLIAHFALAIDTNNRLATNLTMLLLSLPVLCLLWFFRTHDTKEQIQKTQANINTSMLHKAIDFALANGTNSENKIDPVKRAIGLKMLVQLRRTNAEFEMQIDFVTKGLGLKGVNLADADLRRADLQGVDLRGANLYGANLQEANLQEADLQDADLRGAILRRAILIGTKLQGAKLQAAVLQAAVLLGAVFREADLRGADLQGVDLQGADLRGADLQGVDMKTVHLQGAYYDSTTHFPPDFNPQDADMIEDSPPQ